MEVMGVYNTYLYIYWFQGCTPLEIMKHVHQVRYPVTHILRIPCRSDVKNAWGEAAKMMGVVPAAS